MTDLLLGVTRSTDNAMNSIFSSLSFSKKLLMITLVPLGGLVGFLTLTVLDHLSETRQIEREVQSVAELSQLSAHLANNIHEWQKERGRSAGYIGSGGKNFVTEIQQQYRSTDSLTNRLEQVVDQYDFSKYGGSFQARVERGRDLIEQTEKWRRKVIALETSAAEAVAYYTSLINNYLDLIESVSHLTEQSEITLLIIAYVDFLRAKENMGIERAVLSNAFGSGAFKDDFFVRYCTVIANQKTYLSAFRALGRPEHVAFYERTVRGNAVDQVAAWRRVAFEKALEGGFGVDPDDWFDRITQKIDLMKQVEDQISDSIIASASSIRAANKARFAWLVSLSTSVIAITLLLSFLLAKATTRTLVNAVKTLQSSSRETLSAADQVAEASSQMAREAHNHSNHLNKTSDRLEELTESTTGNTKLAEDANQITEDARNTAECCLQEMDALRAAMTDIQSSGDEISAIIKTIDEIAFQTNILALNAAVEAARAGDSGVGFAVVADEVRILAQRCAQAASETAQKIEDSIQRSSRGSGISDTAGASLEQIVGKVRDVDDVVSKIAAASEQQLGNITSIQSAAKTQENSLARSSSSTEETSTAARQLQHSVSSMQACIADLARQAGKETESMTLDLEPAPDRLASASSGFKTEEAGLKVASRHWN